MKNCPHCKKTISKSYDVCPHCHCVLIERINTGKSPRAESKSVKKLVIKNMVSYFKNIRFGVTKIYLPILVLVLIVLFIGSQRGKVASVPISVIPDTSVSIQEVIPTKQGKDPKDYVSLSNGYVLYKNSRYLLGLGELKIVNGTSLDAIAKVVNIAFDKSVYSVYVKANSTLNIVNISDGQYKLFFNLGNDWDKVGKYFTTNKDFQVFEENFNFETTNSYSTTFSVTLNPVVGGQARTDAVSEAEFAKY